MAVTAQEARKITNSSDLPKIHETSIVVDVIIPLIVKRSKTDIQHFWRVGKN